jgi:hypothetical protein
LHDRELTKLLYTRSGRGEQNLKVVHPALEYSKVNRLSSAGDDDVDCLVVPGRWQALRDQLGGNNMIVWENDNQ